MFNRVAFKENGKIAMNRNYWTCFAVAFVAGLASGGGASSGANANMQYTMQSMGMSNEAIAAVLFAVFATAVIAIGIAIFVGYPLRIGTARFFMENRESKANFNIIGKGFTNGNYWKSVKAMWAVEWRVFLWSLLFVIPGIIKAYQYALVPYIIAENPDIPVKRALEISRKMTDGDKLNYWVMELSFIGWNLLGMLACGIGILFVAPYIYSSFAESYQYFREKAFANGISDAAELPGFGNTQPPQAQF